jgi:sigma-B regulation protein RsbU (phosphoserine phosphatase)
MNDFCTCTLDRSSATADVRGTRRRAIPRFAFANRTYRRANAAARPTGSARHGEIFAVGKLAWDINSARDIQRHGLPDPLDLGEGLGIAGANLPATHLSGDIYDFILNGRKLYFLLCDVCGKGLGSAMIAAHLGRVFRVGARRGWSMEALDRELHETTLEANGSEKYATGILGMLDLDERRLHLMAAGHDAPSFVGGDDNEPITDATALVHCWGSPLGTRLAPPVATVSFGPGQSLLFYTDGVSDQWGRDKDARIRFGRRGLTAAHAGFGDGAAEELCEHVLLEALRFGDSAASSDDMTVLALQWRR